MKRRFLLGMTLVGVLSVGAGGIGAVAADLAVDQEALHQQFMALPAKDRRVIQQELNAGMFYQAAVDGAYGPRTQTALIKAAEFIRYNSRDAVQPDLATAQGIAQFLQALSGYEMSRWLYGEGEECDGC